MSTSTHDLDTLQYGSCVTKVMSELKNHYAIDSKDLAEYLISEARKQKEWTRFHEEIARNGAEFSDSFVERIHTLIRKMLPKPPLKKKKKQKKKKQDTEKLPSESRGETAKAFPGLATKNTVPMVLEDDMKRTYESHPSKSSKRSRDPRYDVTRPRERKSLRRDGNMNRGRHEHDHERVSHKRRRDDRPRKLEISEVYEGRVTSVKNFGCFVELLNVERPQSGRKLEGLVNVASVRQGRVTNMNDEVKRGQFVWVKVISIYHFDDANEKSPRIALSMKQVDQKTGKDLNPPFRSYVPPSLRENPSRPSTASSNTRSAILNRDQRTVALKYSGNEADSAQARHRLTRLTSPEMFELAQMKAAGHGKEFLNMHGRQDDTFDENEEEIEIEMREDEPRFLEGQTMRSVNLSAIKVVAMPKGSLADAALTQTALAKERREIKRAKEREMAEVPTNIASGWEDPMSKDRYLAGQLRDLGSRGAYTRKDNKKVGIVESRGRVTNKTLVEQRESLPIFKFKSDLMKAIKENDTMVVIGATGSGKTTQMTQYLHEMGYTRGGRIGCTQPRRVAAMSVAKRVAEEFGCILGQEVGYTIRFDDTTSLDTLIKYMTDGMLLREALLDPDLSAYSVIILDEAHERTIHTDVLFGLLKACVKRRKDLKLIVTSATLNAAKFSTFFEQCPIFSIPGRLFDVTCLYAKELEADYLDAALLCVSQIHLTEPAGDILLFLTGKEEIDTACEVLNERMANLGAKAPPLLVLPVYSALPSELQTKIFDPAPKHTRKCVVATNIAEASLTIDGIYYVVDPGFMKQKVYNAKLGMDSLQVTPISQASADQRAGRAGRTGPGKCFRLYTENAFKTEMLPASVPEIQRTNLENTVLTLKAMGINDLIGFDFMDPPPMQTMIAALQNLYDLGALDEDGLLTRLGRKMAEFPLEPELSKMLLASVDLGCSDEVLTIVAMLTADNIWFRPKERQGAADQRRAKFFQPEGDHLTLLAVYQAWAQHKFTGSWCRDNFVQQRAMRRAQDVRKQLLSIMDRYKLDIVSCGTHFDRVRKAICSGYFMHAAKKDPQEGYKTIAEGQPVYIHPSSALFNRKPSWVIYHKLVLTSREYMRECIAIEPKWLAELAPRSFRVADSTKMSRRKAKEKLEPLYNRYEEPNAWRLSRRRRW